MKRRMRDTPFNRIQLRRARDADIPDCYSQPNLNSEIAWPKQFLWGDIWEEHQKVFIHSSFFSFFKFYFSRLSSLSLSSGFQKGRRSHSGETACLCEGKPPV